MLKRFLVIFPGALGDFICFLPALERLAGEGEVNLLARSDYSDLVPPGVRVRSLECHEISRLFAAESGREDGVARLLLCPRTRRHHQASGKCRGDHAPAVHQS